MAIEPDSLEFRIILYLTIGVVIVKTCLLAYLWINISKRRGEGTSGGSSFIKAIWFLLLTLMVSRIFYLIFDFYYTKFDMALYPIHPQVYYWQMAQFISGLGLAYIAWVVDRSVLQNKFKGVVGIIAFCGAIFQILYPIRSIDDFNFVSTMSILTSIALLFVPLIFLNIGLRASGELRSTALSFAFGIIIYAVGAIVINASILTFLEESTGSNYDLTMYSVQAICKVVGGVLLARATVRFKL